MGILDSALATKGMNAAVKLKILRRHMYAFIRHMTLKKLMNFIKAERDRLGKKTVVSSLPYILKVEPSNICNLHCAYCYDDRRQPLPGERPYGRMSFENFKNLIDEVGEYLFKINLYGFGEPWLFPETLEMIEYATKHNIGVGVSSNMNFKDASLPRRIVASNLEVLIFSCHGVSREAYSRFMGKGDPDLALSNLALVIEERRRLRSKTPLIDWQYCVTGFNEAEIDQAAAKAKELGVDQIRFIKPFFPENAPDEWFSSMFPRQTMTHEAEPSPGCSWVYRSAYVNYDGGLLPCCRDFRVMANDFGNVFTDGLEAIWNNEKYQAARALIKNPKNAPNPQSLMCARCPVVTTVRKT